MRGRPTSKWPQYFMLLIAGLLVGLASSIFVASTPVAAADVVWNEGSLLYNDETYSAFSDRDAIAEMGIPENSRVYVTPFNDRQSNQSVNVLYFEPGVQVDVATSMEAREYTYTPPDKWQKTSSSTVSVDNTNAQPTVGASCDIDAIGWMICGPTMFIANGMDWIYDQIVHFLEVRPLEVTSDTSTFYVAWSIMRDLANVVFVVSFLFIVYSHVSNFGISAYGLKKMAPRLVIAALLVNTSYLICALLVDLSNIGGYAVKDIFDTMYQQVTDEATANNAGMGSFSDIVQTFLAGGTLVLAGINATGGVLTAAVPFLVPLLAVLFVALLVALLVIAARQALIVILIIIAPVAFVLYLLPGTEKWFDKWKSTFFTMLIFFPAFSFVFGASQVAGMLIITNAQTVIIFILGLAVQLAPLAITPLILKLGGGLLNRFAGIVNNPSKGIIDQSKQWAQKRSKLISANSHRRLEAHERDRDNRIINGKRRGRKWYDSVKPYGGVRRISRYASDSSRLLDDQVAEAEQYLDNSYRASSRYQKLDLQKRGTEQDKEMVAKALNVRWNDHLQTDQTAIERDLNVRVVSDEAQLGEAKINARYEAFKTGLGDDHGQARLHQQAADLTKNIAIQGLATQGAQRTQNNLLAEHIEANTNLQDLAGYVENLYFGNNRGSQRVLASALQTVSGANEDAVKNANVILEHGNYTDREKAMMALGSSVPGGPTVTSDIQTAAVRTIFGGKNDIDLTWALKNMDLSTISKDIRQEIGDALLRNGDKPAWLGNKIAADIKVSDPSVVNLSGQDLFDTAVTAALNQNKFGSADKILSQTPGYIQEIVTALSHAGTEVPEKVGIENKKEIIKQIILAKQNPIYKGRIAERKDQIAALYNTLVGNVGGEFYPNYDKIPETEENSDKQEKPDTA